MNLNINLFKKSLQLGCPHFPFKIYLINIRVIYLLLLFFKLNLFNIFKILNFDSNIQIKELCITEFPFCVFLILNKLQLCKHSKLHSTRINNLSLINYSFSLAIMCMSMHIH